MKRFRKLTARNTSIRRQAQYSALENLDRRIMCVKAAVSRGRRTVLKKYLHKDD
jgi:hypothetical protein